MSALLAAPLSPVADEPAELRLLDRLDEPRAVPPTVLDAWLRARQSPSRPVQQPDANPALGWQDLALCAQTDPEAFFPEKGGSTREAKLVCQNCEVRAQCLEYALRHDERFGIWGGLSERERRKLRRR